MLHSYSHGTKHKMMHEDEMNWLCDDNDSDPSPPPLWQQTRRGGITIIVIT